MENFTRKGSRIYPNYNTIGTLFNDSKASLVAQMIKNVASIQEAWV